MKYDLGSRWVWIPMLVIVGSMWARLIVAPTMETFAGGCFGVTLFGVYLAGRTIGRKLQLIFPIALVIQAVSVIGYGILYPGDYAGGIITSPPAPDHTANYDIATGFIVFAWVLSYKWRKLLAPLTLISLFFTGASEAVVSVVILGGTMLLRRDWNKWLWISLVSALLVAALWFSLGHGERLYAWFKVTAGSALTGEHIVTDTNTGLVAENPLWGRFRVIQESFRRLKPLGNGYEVVKFTEHTVHNVPLIILDQLGFLAAISWVIVTGYCFIRTGWKYAWIGVISLCLFDHYIWTQLAPWWWVLAGISTKEIIANDYIFKNNSGHSLLQ